MQIKMLIVSLLAFLIYLQGCEKPEDTCQAPENLSIVKAFQPFDDAAEQMLLENGFVVLGDVEYDRLSELYYKLFEDETGVPVFITTDALLHVFHITYDDFLETAERLSLASKLEDLTSRMNACVKSEYLSISSDKTFLKEAARRLWVVFAVGEALIHADTEVSGDDIEPIEDEANDYLDKIYSHSLTEFYPGDDYTQYEPRGHYDSSEGLQQYFRTVKWLSRRIFRVYDPYDVETSEYELASAAIMSYVLIRSDCDALSLWEEMYNFTSTLINVADSITPVMVDNAMSKTFGSEYDSSGYALLDDHENLTALRDELLSDNYPESEIIPVPLDDIAVLPKKYVQFMGERYVMDSEVMQNTMDPLVPDRFLPKGLDVAATVLDSDVAYEELQSEMIQYPKLKKQIDTFKDQFEDLPDSEWQKSTYNYWLYTLRSLSEISEGTVPCFMKSKFWQKEKLNTVMASWSELRHDNILYTKSNAGAISIEDGYGLVEPYPEFYSRLKGMCEQIINTIEESGIDLPQHKDNFEWIVGWTERFGAYATKILANEKLTEEEKRYIKAWGNKLANFFYPFMEYDSDEYVDESDPELIVDIATNPANQQVLHEAVGKLNPIIVIYKLPEDNKTIAALGYVMSYYEIVEENYNHLNDEEWKQLLSDNPPSRPTWTEGYLYSP